MFRVFVALLCCSAGLLTAQDGEDEWQILLASAQRKFDQGNLTSAENDFVEIADAYSEEPEATRPRPAVHLAAQAGLLTIDLRRGRYDRLIESPGELDEDIASSTPVLGLRARALLAVGRHEEAQSLWRRRLAADPADMEARYELGVVLHADGRRAAARQVWQELVAMPTPSAANGRTPPARGTVQAQNKQYSVQWSAGVRAVVGGWAERSMSSRQARNS